MAGLSVDAMLDRIGSLGRYQLLLLFVLSYMEWVNVGFQVMLLTFVAAEPPWKCASNSSVCQMTGEFKPGDTNYSMRCNMLRSDWEFTTPFTSVVTEFDLVCDNTVLASVSSSVVFAGWLAASLLSGVLSDKIGRKPVLFVFVFCCALFGLIGAFPQVYWFFTVCRFLTGVGIGGCGMPMFVIMTEFVGVKHRHVAGTSLWYSWTLSLLSLAGIAYLVRDWRTLTIVCSVPGLPVVLAWLFVPESARYLILKGKVKETETIMRKIAKTNRKEYPTEALEDLSAEGQQQLGDFRDLFRTKKMAHRTLVCWYSWFVNALVYYGVSFASPSLGGNMYFNFFLTSVIEIPANYACIYLMGKLGRKKPLVFGLIVASLASIGAVILTMYDPGNDSGFQAGRIVMAMVAKFCVMMSFDVIYVYAAELFPTVIRNVGMGTSTAAARIGSFSAPYVVNLNRIHPLLPFGIMAAKALLAGLLCLTLPETQGVALAETMEQDAEVIANNVVIPLEDAADKQPPPDEIIENQMAEKPEERQTGDEQGKEMGVVNTAF